MPTYVKQSWMRALPREEALTEEDALLLSTLDAVIPVQVPAGMALERVFDEWLDAGKRAGIVSNGDAARLWKRYAAGEA